MAYIADYLDTACAGEYQEAAAASVPVVVIVSQIPSAVQASTPLTPYGASRSSVRRVARSSG